MIVTESKTTLDIGIDGECPICAQNPPFNAVTLAAMQETEDMISGKIPSTWYSSPEELINALKNDINS